MSRITKQIANDVAIKMTATKREVVKLKKQFYKEFIYNELRNQIPKNILDFYEQNPRYVKTYNYVRISGNGFNYECVVLDKSLPSPNSNTFEFLPSEKTAKTLLGLKLEFEKLGKETDDLFMELQNALIGLRTYNSVNENLPEAFEFLPTIKTTTLQLNISDLRKKLK
jgi:hypothetical protein